MRPSVRRDSARGFTLLEVLVAVFVLAVGMLGAAAAQVTALRVRQHAGLMSSAVQLASTLADHMRANLEQMRGADAANPYLSLRHDGAQDGAPAAGALCHAGAGCSSAELAQFDIDELKRALHTQFPGGRVLVCRDGRIWDAARGALSWDCQAGAGAPIVIKLGWRARAAGAGPDAARPFAPSVAMVLGEFE